MIAPHIISQARTAHISEECERRGILLKGRGQHRTGPCPRCGGTDRFSIHASKNIFFCRGCEIAGDVIELVRVLDNSSFQEAVKLLAGDQTRPQAAPPPPANKQSPGDYEAAQHRKAAWLWWQRKPITGTIAETYLRSRGITCALPKTLGFLPPCKPEHHLAMIAAFGLVDEPEPGQLSAPRNVESVHLTLLKSDGSGKANVKPNKIIIGSPDNLPITVAPPNDLLGLALTEGIEDALALHQALGLGAWAAGSSPFLPKLASVVPDCIECVTVEMHPDNGRRFAEELTTALRARGMELIPREAVA
jgi:putative DNA primase/helicase